MSKVLLKTLDVSLALFNKVLTDREEKYPGTVKEITEDEFNKYRHGCRKAKLYFIRNNTKEKKLITLEGTVKQYIPNELRCDKSQIMWYQVILRVNEQYDDMMCHQTITGDRAYAKLMQVIQKSYTKDEVKEIIDKTDREYEWYDNQPMKIIHFEKNFRDDKIHKLEHCFYYDINSAYCSGLAKLFPRAFTDLENLYLQRKKNPEIKKWFNYGVGWLKHLGHVGSWCFIAKNTADTVQDAIKSLSVKQENVVYINTDGFIVANPANPMGSSDRIGKFKCELYDKPVFVYHHERTENSEPYWIMEYDNQLKGRAAIEARDMMSLKDGRITEYKRITLPISKCKILDEKSLKTIQKEIVIHE